MSTTSRRTNPPPPHHTHTHRSAAVWLELANRFAAELGAGRIGIQRSGGLAVGLVDAVDVDVEGEAQDKARGIWFNRDGCGDGGRGRGSGCAELEAAELEEEAELEEAELK